MSDSDLESYYVYESDDENGNNYDYDDGDGELVAGYDDTQRTSTISLFKYLQTNARDRTPDEKFKADVAKFYKELYDNLDDNDDISNELSNISGNLASFFEGEYNTDYIQYKNGACFYLGYYVASGGHINGIDNEHIDKAMKILSDYGGEYSDNIKKYDVIRYAIFVNNLVYN
jgi:hypothetical protein